MPQDKPASIERLGIEEVPASERHGTAGREFTLWFAANLTVADYVIGVLTVLVFGLSVEQALPILALGNLLGGLVLGLSAGMGPSLGLPQMFSSRSSFGRVGNYIPGALNWVSTAGWFAVNTVLATEAIIVLVPSANFVLVALVLVAVQAMIAIYGHDLIHLFEKVMSIVLGLLFLLLFALAVSKLGSALSFRPAAPPSLLGAVATVLAASFSYIMSWSPYASDYSRYLPSTTSKTRVALLTLAGGGLASLAVEVLGSLIGAATGSTNYFGALDSFSGGFGALAICAMVLGAVAANALNIYTNSLSALVLDVKTQRWKTVVAGAVVGAAISLAAGSNFVDFFENFLLVLDYWITPWLAIVLVDFYVARRTTSTSSKEAPPLKLPTLGIYIASICISVPFMVPAVSIGPPVGSLAGVFGGGDFSYFISFSAAGILEYLYLRWLKISKA